MDCRAYLASHLASRLFRSNLRRCFILLRNSSSGSTGRRWLGSCICGYEWISSRFRRVLLHFGLFRSSVVHDIRSIGIRPTSQSFHLLHHMSHSLLILTLRLRTKISPLLQRGKTRQSLLHPLPPHSPSHSPPHLHPSSFFRASSRQLQPSDP